MDTDSVGAVITELGGAAVVARELSAATGVYLASSTVSSWKNRNSVDSRWWVKLVELAARAGKPVSYERMARIHDRAAQPAGATQ